MPLQGGATAIAAQPSAAQTKRTTKERIKTSTIAVYASVFVLLVSIVAVGYRAPEQSAQASNGSAAPLVNAANYTAPTADDVVATRIAAQVASTTELAIAGNISEYAVSAQVEHELSLVGDANTVTKPTIVELSSASRNIKTYTVVEGDTVPLVAQKFGLSTDTIKWANNLVGDSLSTGKVLDILPRNGIVYTVKGTDSIDSIAQKYKASASTITTYNDLEISGLSNGLKIIIPDGQLPVNERPGYVSVSYTSYVSGYGTWSGQVLRMTRIDTAGYEGGYAPGNCTAYAYMRRLQMGRPIPTNLGNAYTWATVASRTPGLVVNGTPAAGAVIQAGNHVGIVEEVLPNGDLRITDMNYGYRLYQVAERIIPASTVGNYRYIH